MEKNVGIADGPQDVKSSISHHDHLKEDTFHHAAERGQAATDASVSHIPDLIKEMLTDGIATAARLSSSIPKLRPGSD
jgi:hypothetical protein